SGRSSLADGQAPEDTHRLDGALDSYLHDQGFERARTLASVAGCWVEVVGPDVAAHASPRSLHDGELHISIDHPAWATEIALLSEGILAALAEHLGGKV